MEGTEFYFKEEKNISLILEVNSKNILGGVLLKKKKKKIAREFSGKKQ